jgi:hypothetical protein
VTAESIWHRHPAGGAVAAELGRHHASCMRRPSTAAAASRNQAESEAHEMAQNSHAARHGTLAKTSMKALPNLVKRERGGFCEGKVGEGEARPTSAPLLGRTRSASSPACHPDPGSCARPANRHPSPLSVESSRYPLVDFVRPNDLPRARINTPSRTPVTVGV